MSGRVKYSELIEKERKQFLGDFYSMITSLKTKEEVKNFFKDLLSLSEVVMVSRRIQVAKLLMKGKTYEEIRKELKVGFSNIAQVEKWLNNGFGGYRNAIRKSEKGDRYEYFNPESSSPYSRAWVRKKYPAHYLLYNLIFGRNKK